MEGRGIFSVEQEVPSTCGARLGCVASESFHGLDSSIKYQARSIEPANYT